MRNNTALFLIVLLGLVLAVAIAPKCEPSQAEQWLRGGTIGQSCVIKSDE